MIKFLDLQSVNQQYTDELKQAASEVIDSGWYILGERVKQFENSLEKYIGVKHVIGVAWFILVAVSARCFPLAQQFSDSTGKCMQESCGWTSHLSGTARPVDGILRQNSVL